PEAWLKDAVHHPGSWWVDWSKWIAERGGENVPARVPGAGKLKVIEDAPGSYVAMRAESKS
ncbi:MAG: poly[(R)-3-hydroxyalkanoate] polymerase subunit PhaC, partial [Betaproteobacteria bacterium]